jgi:hypothetical protein
MTYRYRSSKAPRSLYAYKRTASYRQDKEAADMARAVARFASWKAENNA